MKNIFLSEKTGKEGKKEGKVGRKREREKASKKEKNTKPITSIPEHNAALAIRFNCVPLASDPTSLSLKLHLCVRGPC